MNDFRQGLAHDNTVIIANDFNNIANQELKNATRLLKVVYGDIDIILDGLKVSVGVEKFHLSKGVALSKDSDYLLELRETTEDIIQQNKYLYLRMTKNECEPRVKVYKEEDGTITSRTLNTMYYLDCELFFDTELLENEFLLGSFDSGSNFIDNVSIIRISQKLGYDNIDIGTLKEEINNRAPINTTLADATASNTLPTTTNTPLTSLIQTIRDNLKWLLENKAPKQTALGKVEESITLPAITALDIEAILKVLRNNISYLNTNKAPSTNIPLDSLASGRFILAKIPTSATANRVLSVGTANADPAYTQVSDAMISGMNASKLSGTIVYDRLPALTAAQVAIKFNHRHGGGSYSGGYTSYVE